MKTLNIALIVLLPLFASAQENKSFTVTGTALKSVAPNEMRISAGVTSEGTDAQKTYTIMRDKMASAMAYLKGKKGVKSYESDVVQMYRLLPSHVSNSPYNCTQTLSIVLTDFSLYDQLMLDLFAMGFNAIGDVQFMVSNLLEVKRQAQIEAIKAAKEKAVVFAKELNIELGPVISFSEESFYSPYANTANYKTMDAGSVSGPSIAPNQVEVMMSVIVSFAIKSE